MSKSTRAKPKWPGPLVPENADGAPRPLALVVDDDAAMRMMIAETLEGSGFDVEEAEEGAAGLSLFQKHHPDLILMDVMMPGMDGFSACAALRQLPGGEHVPVLMITGLEDMDSINRAYEVGATDFVSKPINYTVLGYRVRYMLRARRAMLKVENTMNELRSSQKRLANAQRIAKLGNWEWDLRTDSLSLSEQTWGILGLEGGEFDGSLEGFFDLVHPEDRTKVSTTFREAITSRAPFSIEHRIVLSDESVRIVHQEAEIANDGEATMRVVGAAQDITDRKKAEQKILHLAYYDTLTGLPNRAFLKEQMNCLIEQAKRYDRILAILSLDLDMFKRINDSLGHSAGDSLLRHVAKRLLGCMRNSDYLIRKEPLDPRTGIGLGADTVVHLGGDEFIIVLTEVRRAEDGAVVANRVTEALSRPFKLGTEEIYMTASIGIIVYPDNGEDVETLLKNADAALHHAKEMGRNRYQFYTHSLNDRALERLSLGNSLYKAVEREEFELHYQPKVELSSGRLAGVEALIRWNHDQLGYVSPSDFVPLAEENGLILTLGEWVLRTACQQNKVWQEAGLPPMRVAVNLSARQFKDPQLADTIEKVLADTGLGPEHLEVELTEGILMEDSLVNGDTLQRLKSMGVQIALDDFGTGYSSLSYLTRFPIDVLKIDKSFIRDISEGREAIVTAIIALSRSLHLSVVAEGVETEQQLEFLYANHCDEIQGNYFSRPLPPDALVEWARAESWLADIRHAYAFVAQSA